MIGIVLLSALAAALPADAAPAAGDDPTPAVAAAAASSPPARAPGTAGQRARRADPSPSTFTADTQNQPPPGLLGDVLGARSWLAARGVDLTARYASESAFNARGGERHLFRETGQLDVGATADMSALVGLEGGTLQTTITWRRGQDLGADAGLGLRQQVQEVYGRGQTWRLTQFWYEQAIGRVRVKLGRSAPGEDFQGFSCHFQNLSFCGAQPGNLVGDYWYNWPVSQWSARVRYDLGNGFAQIGTYEVNPRNLEKDFFSWRSKGQTGVLVPVEVGWAGTWHRTGHVWSYRAGGWWTSADGDDVLHDAAGQPLTITGAEPMRHSGRFGGWVALQQQITGRAENGKALSGLTVYLNVTQADRQTSVTDNQIALGLFYKGPNPAWTDVVGIGLARTNVNGRAVRGGTAGPDPRGYDAEYAAEIYYSLHPADWLELRPNIQGIHQPGGRRDARDVLVFGLKGAATL
jgi:porin